MEEIESPQCSRDQLQDKACRPAYLPTNQRKSQSELLFLKFLKYTGLIYLLTTLAIIPIWVGIFQLQITYLTKTSKPFSVEQFLVMGSMIGINRNCQFHNSRQPKIQNTSNLALSCQKIDKFQYFTKQITIAEYRNYSLLYDLVIQILLIFSTLLLEYKSHQLKNENKGNYIENYTVEISNLPEMPIHILIPKLRHYIEEQVMRKYGLIIEKLSIFDIEGSLTEEQTNYQVELERRSKFQNRIQQLQQNVNEKVVEKLNKQLKQIDLKIKQIQILNNRKIEKNTNRVWVTLSTLQQRYFVLQAFKYNTGKIWDYFNCEEEDDLFVNKKLIVEKAPHPEQIVWKNFYSSGFKKILLRSMTLILNIVLILGFDIVILLMQKHFPHPLLTPLTVLLLQMILKQLILALSSFQLHNLSSKRHVSTMRKLAIFIYINTGLVVFISSYNFGGPLANILSTKLYNSLSEDWYHTVGGYLVVIFLIQILYVSLRVYIDIVKKGLLKFISSYSSSFFKSLEKYQREYEKQEVQLDICYGHILSLLLIGQTYSFNFPIFYPLMSLLMLICYLTHSRFIKFYTKKAPYNNDRLDDNAIRFIVKGVLMHTFFVGFFENYVPSLIAFWVFLTIYLLRRFFISHLVSIIRRLIGPFIDKSSIERTSELQIKYRLTKTQIQQKILQLQSRKQYLFRFINKTEIRLSKDSQKWLRKHEKTIDLCIANLRQIQPSGKSGLNGMISYKNHSGKGQAYKKILGNAQSVEEEIECHIPTVDLMNPQTYP